MKDRIREYIREQQLIEVGDRILVAVSGGADSVCLLYLLNEIKDEFKCQLRVVHINHGLREKDADEDEAYVKEMCDKLGLHFRAYHVDVKELAKQTGMSLEEAGRNARYQAFVEEGRKHSCNKVALAHHMNDTVETVLFHMIRGSGIQGLTGIPVKRELDQMEVIRPLLCVKRDEIENYLHQKEISYCVDSTNLENEYSRNKLRNQIIPLMKEELNEKAVEHIAKTANLLSEMNEYMNQEIHRAYVRYVQTETRDNRITCSKLDVSIKEEHPIIQKGVIRLIIQEMMTTGLKDIDSNHIEQSMHLIMKEVGKQIHLPGGFIIKKQYKHLLFSFSNEDVNKINHVTTCIEINIQSPGKYDLPQIGKTLVVDIKNYKKNYQIPKNGYTKWFDYDKIKNTVFIRTKHPGDYIQIREDGGRKKLKDYFIDHKVPRDERESRLLLTDGQHVMWILGDRTSEAYRIDAQTKKILVISLIGGNSYGYQG